MLLIFQNLLRRLGFLKKSQENNSSSVNKNPEFLFQTTIMDLPMEDVIVTHIGKYLSLQDIITMTRCSREFKKIAFRILRRQRSIRKDSHEMDGQWNINYLRICVRLREMSLHYEEGLTDELLITLVANNPYLEDITLRGNPKITDRGLWALLSLENLKTVYLVDIQCTDYVLDKLNKKKLMELYCKRGMSIVQSTKYGTLTKWTILPFGKIIF